MKISNRFPSIGIPEAAEKEMPVDKYSGPKSLPERPKIESRVDIYEGPVRASNRSIFTLPEGAVPDLSGIDPLDFGFGANVSSNRNAESTDSQPASRVDKYEGPDSLKLPKIESKVDQYKGPDSLKRPEIESEIDKYKGPKSIIQEPKIESRVEKYKGPDSASNRSIIIFPQDAFPDLSGIDPSDIGPRANVPSNRNEESAAVQSSQTATRVEKYKGPDSLKRQELESKVNKYRGPNSI